MRQGGGQNRLEDSCRAWGDACGFLNANLRWYWWCLENACGVSRGRLLLIACLGRLFVLGWLRELKRFLGGCLWFNAYLAMLLALGTLKELESSYGRTPRFERSIGNVMSRYGDRSFEAGS